MSYGERPFVFCRPPRVSYGEDFDAWCAEMRGRRYSIEAIARQARVSQERVLTAIKRVECGRYAEWPKQGNERRF